MTEYLFDERDLNFVLFEQLGIESLFSRPAYKDFSRDEIQLVLTEALKFAQKEVAPTNRVGDQASCRWEDGKVLVPEVFGRVHKARSEGGWIGLTSDPAVGGGGLPLVVGTAVGEMMCGSNCAFSLFSGLSRGAADLLAEFGTDRLRETYAKKLLSGQWQGTMCLTEPGAGTAVGDSKSLAVPNGDHYLLTGNKIFISCADHQFAENVIHLVLARTPGAPPGTKGLSIFVVPKIRVNDDGSLGEPNDVTCPRIEHKMGIKASPTCELSFGQEGKCRAFLIGQEGEGMRIMFTMMNDARIGVGVQGVSIASAAYLLAAAYAKERIQGVRIEDMKNPEAERVAIVEHPDVRRMLATQKAYVEGMRAMLLTTAYYADLAKAADGDDQRQRYDGLVELLTPIVKAYCSDTGFKVTELAIQTHGGYGYVDEYGVEQHCRDAKIASIYEGTNGVQALDLLGRKVARKEGALLRQYLHQLDDFLETNKRHPILSEEFKRFGRYKTQLAETSMNLGMRSRTKGLAASAFSATPYLRMMGNLTMAWQLLEQAVVAAAKVKEVPEDHADKTFYKNKIATARFFIHHLLPENDYLGSTVNATDASAFEIEF